MKVRKKPVIVEAHQWFKNGDHPDDKSKYFTPIGPGLPDESHEKVLTEGKVIKRFKHPLHSRQDLVCSYCKRTFNIHGFIDTLEGGHIVCPGDYIITEVKGEHYPIKDQIFKETYDIIEE